MYQNAQNARLTLYVSTLNASTQTAAFHYREAGDTKVLYWMDRELSFALVGAASRGQLMELAHIAYETFGS